MEGIAIGAKGERSLMVDDGHTAKHLGSGTVAVYATPMMALAMEEAAVDAVDRFLEPGMATVGVSLDVRHLAATPLGMKVKATAELTGIDGRMLTFRVEASDEKERIGEGVHTRAIIDVARFAARLEAKAARKA
ncbi:MAG: thioesterase family protein [Spirochaetes bacterium]|nr:thioesterase family protein [Spirochaetota bacterium]